MNYYYDIRLNLKRENIDSFYEWEQNDNIKHYKKVLLFKVDTKTIQELVNYHIIFDKSFLDEVKNKGIEYLDNELVIVPYIFIVSDGKASMAILQDKDIIYKSNLLIDDDLNILEMVYSLKQKKIPYTIKKSMLKKKFLRQEKETKEKLLKELDNLYKNKHSDILKYIYYELFNKQNNNIKEIYLELKYDINNNFGNSHYEIYDLIVLFNKKMYKL